MPEVQFNGDEAPTVTIPDAEPSTELLVKVLEEGDGAEVQAGDTVTLHYQGLNWATKEIFDQSYGKDAARFGTGDVIPGFGGALVGQTVGTKLVVTIPPALGYGEEESANGLGGQTLVFVVEIQDTESAAPSRRTRPVGGAPQPRPALRRVVMGAAVRAFRVSDRTTGIPGGDLRNRMAPGRTQPTGDSRRRPAASGRLELRLDEVERVVLGMRGPSRGRGRGTGRRAPRSTAAPADAVGVPVRRFRPTPLHRTRIDTSGLSSVSPCGDDRHAVAQRVLRAAESRVRDEHVGLRQQQVVREELRRAGVAGSSPSSSTGRPPVATTTSTSRSASASRVGRTSRPKSLLSIVPWVTCTTGRSPSSSSHHGQRDGAGERRQHGADEPEVGAEIAAGYSNSAGESCR